MQITFISSFVPRKCGIATYTKDLAIELQAQQNEISIAAMANLATPHTYASPVTNIIRQEKLVDYKKVAQLLNNSSNDIIHLQHEFGLFGGADGEYILELAKEITKPLIVTFHTVLLTPSENQKHIIQELTRLSRRVIVMEEIAKDRLQNVYGLYDKDISVIFHGSPTIKMNKEVAKKNIGFPNSFVMLANNLLSRNKGMEYAIEAVGKAVKIMPSLVFLIVGETHPLVKKEEGESYREELQALVKQLDIEKNVIFINKYVSLDELKTFLAAADIYITPYLDPQQITSGTLAYAIGADKACIATDYVYAREMLANGRGIIVPFKNGTAIADALTDLYLHPEKRQIIEKKANSLRKDMSWARVAEKHIQLYKQILAEEHDISLAVKNFIKEPLNISYLSHMTDTTGIIQHAYHTIPNRKFGYSTDDNARALIVVSQLYKERPTDEIENLIKVYVSFMQFAQEPNGKFHTFLGNHNTWLDKEGATDAYGRAMWGLGYYLYANVNSQFAQPVHNLFIAGLPHIDGIYDIRNAAYTIIGLYYYISAYEGKTDSASIAMRYLKKLADFLVKAYEKNHTDDWNWFDEVVTYDNFRIPQALFAAYIILKDEQYKELASTTLQFITNCNMDKKKGYFDFIGQNGWYKKGQEKADYDQQPLEAAGAVEAYLFAAKVLQKKSYHTKALLAFEWFFGRNRNHRYVYDKYTTGVHDGLNLRGVNQNEGAESIVCFLMACLALQEISQELIK